MKNHLRICLLVACAVTMVQCKKEANVTTLDPQNITRTSAELFGRVEDDNKRDVTSRGIVYSTFANPNINNSRAGAGSGLGTYMVTVQLEPNTKYYYRAFATTSKGTYYGEEKSFSTRKYRFFEFGDRIIEVYDFDNAVQQQWGAPDTITGATSIDDGAANTTKVVPFPGNSMAKVCDQLVANGRSDWYLPSANELSAMAARRIDLDLGTGTYWSSTELDSVTVVVQSMLSGLQTSSAKKSNHNCRCIRKD